MSTSPTPPPTPPTPSDSREVFPQPSSVYDRAETVGDILWHDPDDPDGGYDIASLCCDGRTGARWGIDCMPELERNQFCAAAYLASLECGMEFWPQADHPSLCPAHWQLLLDRCAAEDPLHALQHANAQAVMLYQAVRNQMRRAARRSAREGLLPADGNNGNTSSLGGDWAD